MDCEWSPEHFRLPGDKLSLPSIFQIAISQDSITKCFILDFVCLDPVEVLPVLDSLFRNEECVKLGFDFKLDLTKLRSYVGFVLDPSPFVDLQSLPVYEESEQVKPIESVLSKPKKKKKKHVKGRLIKGFSLLKLVEYYLHKTLDKSMCSSNWLRRPLWDSQLSYAISDAVVLVEVYQEYLKKK